ncbi:MAG TPA: polysaccharide biosynthesis tyrosine autokinase [Chthoniobacteraceae bacterium]|nr:polysaccharide biosynthesis tyrosine autokinase [Chthoniobacteraceae bacterium]
MKNVTLVYPSRDQMTGTIWDFRHLCALIRQKARIIILSVFAFLSLASVYLFIAPRIYSSRAVIYVEQRDKKVVDIESVEQEDLEAMEVMKTVEQSLGTDEMMIRVIKANHLGDIKEFGGGDPSNPPTEDQLIKSLSKRVGIKVRRGTRLIDITAKSKDPELARAIAQSFVDEYLRLDIEQRTGSSTMANTFLVREADRLKGDLEQSEHALQTYREQHNAISLDDGQNIVVDALKDLNTQLGQARARRINLESDLNQYNLIGTKDPKALLAIPSISSSPLVLDAQRLVNDQQGDIADLSKRYRPAHPKYIQAEAKLAQLEDDLSKTIVRVGGEVKTDYQSSLDSEHQIDAALQKQEKASSDLNQIAIPYKVLVHNVDADRDLYQSILTRLKETDITKLIDSDPIRLIETPRASSKPVSPKIPLILVASIFMGFSTGVGICLLLHSMDTSLHSVEEAEKTLNLPVIAAVPKLRKSKAAGTWKGMPMVSEPYSVTAEAFRSLRTVLELKEYTERQVLLVTSAIPDEGKTFCSTNAAVSFAQQGYKTLVIDTDLRNPSIAKALHVPAGAAGLVDYLTGAVQMEQAIYASEIPGLSIMAAGAAARNPSELISGAKMETLLSDAALAGYERIILDTPPVNAVSDALHLVKFATSTCLVVRASSTPAKAAQRAYAALVSARVMDAGVVLNCVPTLQYHTYGTAYDKPAVTA